MRLIKKKREKIEKCNRKKEKKKEEKKKKGAIRFVTNTKRKQTTAQEDTFLIAIGFHFVLADLET